MIIYLASNQRTKFEKKSIGKVKFTIIFVQNKDVKNVLHVPLGGCLKYRKCKKMIDDELERAREKGNKKLHSLKHLVRKRNRRTKRGRGERSDFLRGWPPKSVQNLNTESVRKTLQIWIPFTEPLTWATIFFMLCFLHTAIFGFKAFWYTWPQTCVFW